MAISILECDRIDRYQFEVFIGQVDFTGNASKVSDTVGDNNYCYESRPKVEYNISYFMIYKVVKKY